MSFPDLTRHFSYLLAETVDCLHLEKVEWVCAINLDSIDSFFSVTTCYVMNYMQHPYETLATEVAPERVQPWLTRPHESMI